MRLQYKDIARDGNGIIISNANIAVYLGGTTTAANVYTSSTSTTAVNSVTSGSDGSFVFYVDAIEYGSDQTYKIVLTATINGIDLNSYTIDNITIEDAVLGNYTISTARTASYPISIPKGVVYVKSGSGTLTFNAETKIGKYQVFSNFTTGITFNTGSVEQILPQWFGAVGDGIADDQPAVQSAINAIEAGGGGNLYFPSGTYLMTSLHDASQALLIDFIAAPNTKPVTITGSNAILKTAPANAALLLLNMGTTSTVNLMTDVSISGMTFIGTRTPTDTDIEATQNNHLVYLTNVKNVNIHDCTFKNTNGCGVYGLVENTNIHDNLFLDCNGGTQYGYAKHLLITDNQFICTKKADDQIGVFGAVARPSLDITFSNNLVDKGWNGTKKGGSTGTGTNRSWARCIIVGDYCSHVQMTGNTLLNCNSSVDADRYPSAVISTSGAIYIDNATSNTHDIIISNNQIGNCRWGILAADVITYNVQISNNQFRDIEDWAIALSSTAATEGNGLNITGNTLYNIGIGAFDDTVEQGYVVYIGDYNNVNFAQNILNTLDCGALMKVVHSGVTRSTGVTISGNIIRSISSQTQATPGGISLALVAEASVIGNVVDHASGYSLSLENCANDVEISRNLFEGFTNAFAVNFGVTAPTLISTGNHEIPSGQDLTGRHAGLKVPRTDNNPAAATLRRTAMPTTGSFATGDVVYAESISDAGASTILGWLRITTGANNVLNTDWKAILVTV